MTDRTKLRISGDDASTILEDRRRDEVLGGDSRPLKARGHVLRIEGLSFYYGKNRALHDINLGIAGNEVTAFIGPSGCGKSTLLRCINRLGELSEGVRIDGDIYLHGTSIYDRSVDVSDLRRRVGMVFQKSNPFPKTIYENVAYGLRVNGVSERAELDAAVEQSLREAALWDEVKDRLKESALDLSGGQQQRLCIARAIAIKPEIILMDEPCSALDPIATGKIEELIMSLKQHYTIILVTHNMQQAARVSNRTAFLWLGRLIEYDETSRLFTNPSQKLTEDYITGRFG
jgi:phosphate transport system ATP-binding protein